MAGRATARATPANRIMCRCLCIFTSYGNSLSKGQQFGDGADRLALENANSVGLYAVPAAILGLRKDRIGTSQEIFPRLAFHQSGYSKADTDPLRAVRDMNRCNLLPEALSNRYAFAAR